MEFETKHYLIYFQLLNTAWIPWCTSFLRNSKIYNVSLGLLFYPQRYPAPILAPKQVTLLPVQTKQQLHKGAEMQSGGGIGSYPPGKGVSTASREFLCHIAWTSDSFSIQKPLMINQRYRCGISKNKQKLLDLPAKPCADYFQVRELCRLKAEV